MNTERNDRNALRILRQHFEARDQIRDIREEQSARASKLHADSQAGLIDSATIGQLGMEASNYGEDQIIVAEEKMKAAMALLDAWYRGENVLLEKLSM